MDFSFTETQEMFRRTIRDFAQKEIAPGAKERANLDYIPKEILQKIANMGLWAMNLPSEYGGQPADWISTGIAIEEISKADFNCGMSISATMVCSIAVRRGSEELQREWLPSMIRGEKLACIAVTEPDCGSDASAMKARAIREGEHYILSGEKAPVTMATQSDIAIVFAKTDPSARARGVTCFLVPLNSPDISISHIAYMGFKPTGSGSIMMDGVRIPVNYRIGEEGQGFYVVMQQFDVLRVWIALASLGAAQTSLDEAMNYAKQRTAFGKIIGQFEGISFKIAEDATLIEAARLLCYQALWLADQGLPHTKETAMCKWLSCQVAVRAVHDALLIFGHPGYSEEYPLEQRLKDVIVTEFADGTAEIMKLVIAREMMGREILPY
jgi:cyclohexanecarboxyl-CoA dehydrogenase